MNTSDDDIQTLHTHCYTNAAYSLFSAALNHDKAFGYLQRRLGKDVDIKCDFWPWNTSYACWAYAENTELTSKVAALGEDGEVLLKVQGASKPLTPAIAANMLSAYLKAFSSSNCVVRAHTAEAVSVLKKAMLQRRMDEVTEPMRQLWIGKPLDPFKQAVMKQRLAALSETAESLCERDTETFKKLQADGKTPSSFEEYMEYVQKLLKDRYRDIVELLK